MDYYNVLHPCLVPGPQPGVEDEDSEDATSSRAQYVSANCVVFTHYQGDASAVVDEHFSRALDKTSHTKGKIYEFWFLQC